MRDASGAVQNAARSGSSEKNLNITSRPVHVLPLMCVAALLEVHRLRLLGAASLLQPFADKARQ